MEGLIFNQTNGLAAFDTSTGHAEVLLPSASITTAAGGDGVVYAADSTAGLLYTLPIGNPITHSLAAGAGETVQDLTADPVSEALYALLPTAIYRSMSSSKMVRTESLGFDDEGSGGSGEIGIHHTSRASGPGNTDRYHSGISLRRRRVAEQVEEAMRVAESNLASLKAARRRDMAELQRLLTELQRNENER